MPGFQAAYRAWSWFRQSGILSSRPRGYPLKGTRLHAVRRFRSNQSGYVLGNVPYPSRVIPEVE